jgi:HEAT repeat protein
MLNCCFLTEKGDRLVKPISTLPILLHTLKVGFLCLSLPLLLVENAEAKGCTDLQVKLFVSKNEQPELIKCGADTVPTLIPLLNDEDVNVRRNAASALGNLGAEAKASVATLILTLKDKNARVRSNAAYALGNMGLEAKQSVAALLNAVGDEDGIVRSNAANSLSLIGVETEGALPILMHALEDEDALVRDAAANGLSSMDWKVKGLIPELLKALRSENPLVRRGAASVLGRVGERPTAEQIVPALILALQDEDALVRSSAASGLGSKVTEASLVVPALTTALRDRSPWVRQNTLDALAKMKAEARSAVPEITRLLSAQTENRQVRQAAAQALGKIGAEAQDAVPALIKVLENSNEDIRLRWAVVYSFSGIGAEAQDAVPALETALQDKDLIIKRGAAYALRDIGAGAKSAVPALIETLQSEKDVWVLRNTIDALGNIGEASKAAVPDLIKTLKVGDTQARQKAIGALGNIGSEAKQALPILTTIFQDQNEYAEVRVQAANSLGLIGKNDKAIIPILMKGLNDQDSLVSGKSAYALGYFHSEAEGAVPSLVKLLQDKTKKPSVRQNAADSLGVIGMKASVAIPALITVLQDRSGSVELRRISAQAMGGFNTDVQQKEREQEISVLINAFQTDERSIRYEAADSLSAIAYDLTQQAETSQQVNQALQPVQRIRQVLGNSSDFKGYQRNVDEDLKVLHEKQEASLLQEAKQWVTIGRNICLAHVGFWLLLIFAYPRSPQIQAIFFWNPWVRNILGVGYVSFVLTWIPFLRRKLFQPFQSSLLADAGLTHFIPNLYFPDSNVQIDDGIEPIATALPQLKGQIILEGDSGLGKTTFVRHLLKQSKRIAVYLPAPKCTEGVLEAIQKKLHGDEIKDPKFLQSLIYSGAIDIYIDGLNEVSADTRAKIAAFVESHFRGNILITTQPLEWNPPATAKTYVLQPLQPHQIEAYLLTRQPAPTAKRQGTDYQQACRHFSQAIAAATFAPEERQAIHSILSNPMELTLAAWILADNQQPNLLNLRQQQYDLMAADYQRMWNRDFPLHPFSEAVYQLRLTDQQALPAAQFYKELQGMEDEKYRMVISRQWQDAKGEAQKEWVFRHDKIAEFFIVQTFLGNSDEAKHRLQSHIGDSRFRGVYFLLATLLPIDAAQQLREDLINYAADTKDHTVSDTFVQLMRSRKSAPISQVTG